MKAAFPKLVGLADAAQLLRVSKVTMWNYTHLDGFPAPVYQNAAGKMRLWLETEVMEWAERVREVTVQRVPFLRQRKSTQEGPA